MPVTDRPRQGDDHGEAGEDDRGAGRADGPAGRLLARAALADLVLVAGHDEQGVVDADRQAEHRAPGPGWSS